MSNPGSRPADQAALTIGAVARLVGKRPSSIRYYEQIGLLPPPPRVSGRRVYRADTLRTLAVIETGQRAGLMLEEIKALLTASPDDAAAIERLREVAERKLPEITALIERSNIVRKWLECAARCECPRLDQCPLFDDPLISTSPAGKGAVMTLRWTKEDAPRWDADKQRLFGQVELAAVGLAAPAPGEPVADEWWRVTEGDEVAGYGWLDSEWGDARITFFVAPGQRGRGVGHFILEHLEDEAAARGLNYIYNIVPETHPDGPWITSWLLSHGFRESSRGQLRRRVGARPAGARAQAGGAPHGET